MKFYPWSVSVVMGLLLLTPSIRGASIPLFPGLGSHTRPITTTSPEAQKYFDQGLNLAFGFAHGSAIRSFQEAARLDPSCAMAQWGIALASGPDINSPSVSPEKAEQAWKAITAAREHLDKTTPVERALIEALATRYANPQPADRTPLDRAYADAMRKVWQQFPQDADVGALFSEAMMDLRPWDQWTPEGAPQPGTEEIVATIEAVLKLDINHPLANHMYIHALEASSDPGRAIAAADRLLTLQPGIAHNVHMPSHTYIRVGRWDDAIDSNVKAVVASRAFRQVAGPPTGMLLGYNAHNEHMLAYAAMMVGRSALALEHIKAMVDGFPLESMKTFGMEAYAAMPYEVMVRFGKWDDILAAPDHPDWMNFTRAMRRAARGIALAAKGDPKAARAEQAEFLRLAAQVPADAYVGNNTSRKALEVATPMLEGEILYREGKVDAALASLRAAVIAEDALRYDEPPGWILPVRHALGAVLMQEKRYGEAEQVYRDDLARLPGNGWSLFGLAEALRYRHRIPESQEVDAQFRQVWAKADVPLRSSCLCQPGL